MAVYPLVETEEFLRRLQEASKSRAARWHGDAPAGKWSLLEWAGAMCGEAGEAANVAKKIKRIDGGMWGQANARETQSLRAQLVDHLATEVADTILYGICLLNELDFDAQELLRSVFNEKSEAAGFPEKV